MEAFLMSPNTGQLIQKIDIADYEIPLEAYQAENGKATVVGDLTINPTRLLLVLPGRENDFFRIAESVQGDGKQMTLTISDPLEWMNDVYAVYQASSTSTPPDFLTIVRNTFTDYGGTDPFGAGIFSPARYNTVAWTDWPEEVRTILENAVVDPSEYIISTTKGTGLNGTYYRSIAKVSTLFRIMRQLGVGTIVSFYKNIYGGAYYARILTYIIEKTAAYPIFFDDGHNELLSESYNDSNICSALIIWNRNVSGGGIFFLDENFNLFTNAGDQHVLPTSGKQMSGFTSIIWINTSLPSDIDARYTALIPTAQAEFDKNQYSHKIEFASDKEFHIGQPVRLNLKKGWLNSAISKVSIKSGDNRYFYTCGELPQTAAQQIKANSWSYGTRLPENPYKGQLVFI